MIVIKTKKDSLAIEFDTHQTHLEQKKSFFTSPEEIFGYLLLLFRLNLGLNQEQMGAVLIHDKPMSKSGYAKIERADNAVNIQILFDLSYLTGVNFTYILAIYNELIHIIANAENDTVIFNQMCGHYGLGNNGGYMEFGNIGTIKETYKAKLKLYNDIVGQSNIDKFNSIINENLHEEVREYINLKAENVVYNKKNKNKFNTI